jgi:hypothetical protein
MFGGLVPCFVSAIKSSGLTMPVSAILRISPDVIAQSAIRDVAK